MSKVNYVERKAIAHKNEVRNLFIGASAGTLIGATTALLLAPKSGEKLRKDVIECCQGINGSAQGISHDFLEKGKKVFSALSDVTENVKDSASGLMTFSKPQPTISRNLMLGAIGGGLLGITAIMLLAPNAKQEKISNFAHKIKENASKPFDWINTAKEIIDTIRSQIHSAESETENSSIPQKPSQGNIQEALKWAVLGFHLWKNLQKRR
jgi:gas vesicle protein